MFPTNYVKAHNSTMKFYREQIQINCWPVSLHCLCHTLLQTAGCKQKYV